MFYTLERISTCTLAALLVQCFVFVGAALYLKIFQLEIMSFAAVTDRALLHPIWTQAWSHLDSDYAALLRAWRLDSPLIVAHLLRGASPHERRVAAAELFQAF